MPQSSNNKPKRKRASGKAARQASFNVVGDTSEPVRQDYNPAPNVLQADVPLAVAGSGKMNDLITELREISGQVNQMMSQVERAIHRLGIHAGEPLKR